MKGDENDFLVVAESGWGVPTVVIVLLSGSAYLVQEKVNKRACNCCF